MAKNPLIKAHSSGELFTRTGDPFHDLQNEMNRLFDSFWLGPAELRREMIFFPSMDVRETDREIEVTAELPGMEEKDINVTVTDESLTIEGEKKLQREEKEENYLYRENRFGRFRRVFDFPVRVDQNKAMAEFKKGVLHITVPKLEEAKARARKLELKGE